MKTSLKMILLGATLLAAGCAGEHVHDSEESYMNPFVPDGAARRSAVMADAQTSVGDREDGMLYAWHFDGKDLSPLGREKLASIIEADSMEPITIHLDVKDATFADRKKAVVAFMQDKGVADSHINIVEGYNEGTLTPAAAGLAAYAKTDTSVEASAGSSANSNTSSGGSTGTK